MKEQANYLFALMMLSMLGMFYTFIAAAFLVWTGLGVVAMSVVSTGGFIGTALYGINDALMTIAKKQ